jgi:GST-like protein
MITLYTVPTGNGYRASILLEESGLAYKARTVAFADLRSPEFLAVNPIGKAPAIIDDDTPDGVPVAIGESLAIALYLVEKSGRMMPGTAANRARAAMWGAAVVAGFGGAIASIFYARMINSELHAVVITRHFADIATHLGAMDHALGAAPFLGGPDFSWADAIAAPMILSTLPKFDVVLDTYPNILRWRKTVATRPAVQAGMNIPA